MDTALLEKTSHAAPAVMTGEQYSLAKILGIWASAALPMGLIHWVVVPALIPLVELLPGFLYLIMITLGLVWQGIVAFTVLRQEVRPFTWKNLKDRLWLFAPSDPRPGAPSINMYLWIIALIGLTQAYGFLQPFQWLDDIWLKIFPSIAPQSYALIENLAEPALGQWWLLGVLLVLMVFNFLLGEELIFRGILLPKMSGVFGRWDIIANDILFTTYHLHKIWVWPHTLIIWWIVPWAVKQFKSYWVGVILHGFDAIFLTIIFLLAILGMIA